jgi:hypothetical protein
MSFTPGVLTAVLALVAVSPIPAADPLPSWNDGPSKKAMLDFFSKVTVKDSKDFVPPADRIAVFDNDGTLRSEQSVCFHFAFALNRVTAMADKHPE